MRKLFILSAWFGLILLLVSPIIAQSNGQGRGTDSGPCQFPFKYKNIVYTECTIADDPDQRLWCSVKTDDSNLHIQGQWRYCTANDKGCKSYPDGRPGSCISIQECPALSSLRQQAASSPTAVDTLRKSVCSNDGSTVRLCCPSANQVTSQQPPQRPAETPTQNNRRLAEIECGESAKFQRVVKGENAAFGAWPWMVIFRGREKRRSSSSCSDGHSSCPGWANNGECQRNPDFMNSNCRRSCNLCPSVTGSSYWFCGGVLIKDQYVLSAAHCFANIDIEFARIGEYDLSRDVDSEHGISAPTPQDIDVESATIHPNFKRPCLRCNDIAIVKLARPATLHPIFVKPICLPSNPERDLRFSVAQFQNKLAFATGWGVTDAENLFTTRGSDILQQVNLTIQELPYCRQQKMNYPNGRMILCAGQGDGRDVCRADSGGPLMLSDSQQLKWYAVGITSFGATFCGDPNAQGVFTSVHHYMDWINRNSL